MLPLHASPPPEQGGASSVGNVGGLRQRPARPSQQGDLTPAASDILLAPRRGRRDGFGGRRQTGGSRQPRRGTAVAAVVAICRVALPAVLFLGAAIAGLAVWSPSSVGRNAMDTFLGSEGSSSSSARRLRRQRRGRRRGEDLHRRRDESNSDGEPWYRPERRWHLADETATTVQVFFHHDTLDLESVMCGDGTGPFPLNDGYCDCPDGIDETGTSACSQILVQRPVFHCGGGGGGNDGGVAIFASRVGDGIRDCEDGSDET